MSMMYATVTSKGQVTLPVELRRALGIEPGQTIGFFQDGDQTILQVSGDVEVVRAKLEQSARRNGTWGQGTGKDAWKKAAVQRYANT